MNRKQRIDDPKISRVLASPLRLEILGQFIGPEPLAVQDLARRMGRQPTSLHYHIRLLQEVGLLVQTGSRRSGKRPEALYRPSAELYEMALDRESESSTESVRQTMAAILRMAGRDFDRAVADPDARTEGPQRNLLGMRLHMRMTPADLEELNRRLAAVEELLGDVGRRAEIPDDADLFCSLTLLLAPLADRQPH